MNIVRTNIVLLSAVLLTMALSSYVKADIYWYDVMKENLSLQTSNLAPTAPFGYRIQSRVFFDNPTDFTAAQTTYSGSQSPLNYSVNPSGTAIYYSPTYSTAIQRDAAFPSGSNYNFSVSGGTLGSQIASLQTTSAQMFSVSKPNFTGDTYDRLQTYNPNAEFELTFNSHAVHPNANGAVTFLTIIDNATGNFAFLANVSPSTTSFTLPTGILEAGKNYSAEVIFSNRFLTQNAGFGSALTSDDYQLRNSAVFSTVPEPGCLSLLFLVSLALVSKRRTRKSDSRKVKAFVVSVIP